MSKKVAVIAIGGNSLIKDKAHQSVQDQYLAADETAKHIVEMIKEGWDVVVGHGNGPQVGFLLQKAEIAEKSVNMPMAPLEVCGAQSQGQIGYQLVQCLQNRMKEAGIDVDAFDALSLAEQAGSTKAVNIVLMGHLSNYFSDFTEEDWRTALKESVPARFLDLNQKAFTLGREA